MDNQDFLTISEKEVKRLEQESSLGNDTAAVDFYSYALLDYRRHLIKNQKALDAVPRQK